MAPTPTLESDIDMEDDPVPALSLSDFPRGLTWDQRTAAERLIDCFNQQRKRLPYHVAIRIAHLAKTGLPNRKHSVGAPTLHKYFRTMFGPRKSIRPRKLSWEKWWVLAAIYGCYNPRLQPAAAEFSRRLGKHLDGMEYPGSIPPRVDSEEVDTHLNDNNSDDDEDKAGQGGDDGNDEKDGGNQFENNTRGEEDGLVDDSPGPNPEGSLFVENNLADLSDAMSDTKHHLESIIPPRQEPPVLDRVPYQEIVRVDVLDALHEMMIDCKPHKIDDIQVSPPPNILSQDRDNSSDDEVVFSSKQCQTRLEKDMKELKALKLQVTNLQNTVETVLKTQQSHEARMRQLVAPDAVASTLALLGESVDQMIHKATELRGLANILQEIYRANGRSQQS
ncbi:hypothetical protein BGZ63DRAFT_374294 [Mariannaea sp. PMI_226]|nr:hypothetical protein BGZ63DRAFT_374294 [Mariannaea sp. PMI_226]